MIDEVEEAIETNNQTLSRLENLLDKIETVLRQLMWSMIAVGVVNVLTLIAVAWLVL